MENSEILFSIGAHEIASGKEYVVWTNYILDENGKTMLYVDALGDYDSDNNSTDLLPIESDEERKLVKEAILKQSKYFDFIETATIVFNRPKVEGNEHQLKP